MRVSAGLVWTDHSHPVEVGLRNDPTRGTNEYQRSLQLVGVEGLDAGDFIDVINALSNIKQRDAAKEEKEQAKAAEKKNKIFVDKEFVFEGRDDAFIQRWKNKKWAILPTDI